MFLNEIYNVREITESIDRNLVDSLNIKHIFITDYSFEIISSDPEIISPKDSIYTKLAKVISKITFKNCHDFNKNSHIFEHLALVTSLKIITCDTADEIEELSIKYHLEKVSDHFYINKYKAFNFIKPPWDKIFMPAIIVTLNPETMAENMGEYHLTANKFGFYVTLTHAIGKLYTISQSLRSASANFMITSWNLDENCENLESTFNYWKRKFSNNEMDFYNLFRDFKELVLPLTLLANQTYQVRVLEEEYGPIISFHIGDSLDILRSSDANKLLDEPNLTKAFMDDLKIFGETLSEFLNKFQDTINNWREIYRSKINHYQMLGTMIALFIAIIALVFSDKLWQLLAQLIKLIIR